MDDREGSKVPHDWEQVRTGVLVDNTAQGIYKHLQALESNRERVLPRWIWELLQNARDASVGNASLKVSVEMRGDELIFCHNGRGFQREEIAHLIYHGSTKLELDGSLGQFGSGFLTTHLLSRAIEVFGHMEDGQTFAFTLDRSGETAADLQRNMDASFEEFTSSLAPAADGVEPGMVTKFRYLIDQRASEAVDQGLHALELAGPHVAAFNQQFKRIEFLTQESRVVLELKKRRDLVDHIKGVGVDVSASAGAPPERRSHVVAERDGVAVAIPCVHRDGKVTLESPTSVPKLFLGFPLIGTEDFSFPAIVHSLRFSPTEERDGVYLGQSDNQDNRENQAVIERACKLLLSIAEFAVESGWSDIHVLAVVPPIHEKPWLNQEWLCDRLMADLVDPIRDTSLVVNEYGVATTPKAAKLPTADSSEAVDQLWRLVRGMASLKEKLPRQSEASGWCDAARSWAPLYDCPLDEFEETMNGRDLACDVEDAGSIEELQAQLEDVDAVIWLDEFHEFLSANGFSEELRNMKIVSNQQGEFSTLLKLHRDCDIPNELKDIAQLVGWNLRAKLRDTRFDTFSEEPGAGDFDSDFIISKLIDLLRECMEEDALDDDAKAASVRLFSWIAKQDQDQWHHIDGFPTFADEGDKSIPIKLIQHEDEASERPLAPIRIWSESLRPYADLFPRHHILADDFATTLDDPSEWASLEQRGFLRTSVLYTTTERFDKFLPAEPLPEDKDGQIDHKTESGVEITNIAFLIKKDIGVLARVRQSRKQARLFWNFLTQWLVAEDARGLEAQETKCECESVHCYYPAGWLVPLVRNKWVPLGRGTDLATARSIGNLVRDSEWSPDFLLQSQEVKKLLKALRISIPELIMDLFAEDDGQREELGETLATLLTCVGSDQDRLNALAKDFQDDPQLLDHLEERRQHRRRVHENQRLGALVEQLVKESLEGEGFDVQLTGTGSDFEIQPNAAIEDERVRLELIRDGRTWLVEIKSARDNSVRMTATQVQEATRQKSRYLLCVVPISGIEDPDIEVVHHNMRFVGDIGNRLEGMYAKLGEVENLRERVTVEDADGLCLELDSGSPRVRIRSTVWESGFGLQDLADELRG